VLYKSLFELSASPNKAEMVAAVDKMMQPDPQQQQLQQLMQQLEVAERQAKINKLNAEAMKAMAEAGSKGAESALAEIEARIKLDNQRLEEINTLIEAQFAAVAMKQTQQEDRDLDIKEAKLEIDRLKARKQTSGK
jgi:phosphosulfolactate synthase (CoM biosynthesis protein A)